MEQDDDRLDALRLEDRDERVDRVGLVVEVDVRGGRAVTMLGVPSRVMPTTAISTPGNSWMAYGGKMVSPVSL